MPSLMTGRFLFYVPRDPGCGHENGRTRDVDTRGSGAASLRTAITGALPRSGVAGDEAGEETPKGEGVFSPDRPLATFFGFPPGAVPRPARYGGRGSAS